MRQLTKGPEPKGFQTYRLSTPGLVWESLGEAQKQPLREALAGEQRGLCAYCCSRIRPSNTGACSMRIEHLEPRSTTPDRALDWTNMVGVCEGGTGPEPRCDRKRGARPLPLNPLDPHHRCQERLTYRQDGTVAAADPALTQALDQVLGLNSDTLRLNRKKLWKQLGAQVERDPTLAGLERLKALKLSPDGEGNLCEFAPLVEHYLARKRRALG